MLLMQRCEQRACSKCRPAAYVGKCGPNGLHHLTQRQQWHWCIGAHVGSIHRLRPVHSLCRLQAFVFVSEQESRRIGAEQTLAADAGVGDDGGPAVSDDLACESCSKADRCPDMLICSTCTKGAHFDCIGRAKMPPSKKDWHCEPCARKHYNKTDEPPSSGLLTDAGSSKNKPISYEAVKNGVKKILDAVGFRGTKATHLFRHGSAQLLQLAG